jgi:hypothetical protein
MPRSELSPAVEKRYQEDLLRAVDSAERICGAEASDADA